MKPADVSSMSEWDFLILVGYQLAAKKKKRKPAIDKKMLMKGLSKMNALRPGVVENATRR